MSSLDFWSTTFRFSLSDAQKYQKNRCIVWLKFIGIAMGDFSTFEITYAICKGCRQLMKAFCNNVE